MLCGVVVYAVPVSAGRLVTICLVVTACASAQEGRGKQLARFAPGRRVIIRALGATPFLHHDGYRDAKHVLIAVFTQRAGISYRAMTLEGFAWSPKLSNANSLS